MGGATEMKFGTTVA